MIPDEFNSGIYKGIVRHRRFSPKVHQFGYNMYMFALDLDEAPTLFKRFALIGERWFNPFKITNKDHFGSTKHTIKTSVIDKLKQLTLTSPLSKQQQFENGCKNDELKIVMVTQARCLGVYFSPINLYFCYHGHNTRKDKCIAMLAEVSNTPWNEKHYYLIDVPKQNERCELRNPKAFHVSPFMPMDMDYVWKITPPAKHLNVHIENWQHPDQQSGTGQYKVFDATMTLKKQAFTSANLTKLLIKVPMMTVKISAAIYWQAAKLFAKRVPFIGHPGTTSPNTAK
ncbi:DUF1365 domain-containing protein [Psychrosphaera ytuae]|uniref:DUF1365 domain-containing protein n=1 Tax=Psychrosphaera ytuae TaxID=2820710 RepID=A0A975HJA9_9GAMM|nr:DUF1365 domain-containing protein [Psychrosphaera ytuae]QTH65038.1 DUF1365 domain-containing protein [Psychrosphaera ytuae]